MDALTKAAKFLDFRLTVASTGTASGGCYAANPNFHNEAMKQPFFPRKLLALFVSSGLFVTAARAERQTKELTDGWKFLRQDTAALAKTDSWQNVTVPHTWNAIDGANGLAADPQYSEGYYRGPAWYARPLDIPPDWKGKRVFIRFEGVSLIADVLVNDISIGQHRGAFAAFCFEITPYLKFDGTDSLRVRADNARTFDVPPLSGDFTIFGGIYRPVKVFATDPVCVTPLEHASPGVFLTTKKASAEEALIEARTLVSNGEKAAASVEVEVELNNAEGFRFVVLNPKTAVELAPGETKSVVTEFKVHNPRLWQGRKDPYLYSVTVRVKRGGKAVDEVTQPLGIRIVALDPQRGFLLNGEPYPLHGVNRHQDRAIKGWAISDADHEEDHAIIREVGATTIRLAHYQQAETFHNLSDRTGIIEWQEIPLVDTVGGSPQFLENARQQLREMILQTCNHPSIAMWGIFNELDPGWAQVKTAPAPPILENLQKLAKELDPTRPTVAASFPEDADDKHPIPDGIAWNIYPGWYGGKADDASGIIEKYSSQMGGKRIALSEYGAGANPEQFQEGELTMPKHDGPFHPQEWQNHFHERLWAQCKDNPKLFGTWIWAMFDFAVDKRNEGSIPGLNDKGIVTRDRKVRKDTFYFYKANWTPEPMVYIASRRMTPRKQATTEIKVYSNCEEVELKVNGKTIDDAKPDDTKAVRWLGVALQPGKNRIEVTGKAQGRTVGDWCEWDLQTNP